MYNAGTGSVCLAVLVHRSSVGEERWGENGGERGELLLLTAL